MSRLFTPFLQMFWIFATIAFFCEMGEMVTDQFEKFNTKLYQCDWYLFPIEVQRMLVIFMSDTQKPVFIHGYGNILCIRENFKKVNDSAIFSSIHFYSEKPNMISLSLFTDN